ncbi:SGNH/GDSL hydrolase family protein [Candidatus Hydrogenedentota bacterium]
MKRVVLIGDSIRGGYQETVRRELDGVADIWAPAENGGPSFNVLNHFEEWVIQRSPDVAHINCGLHDIKKTGQDYQAPIDQYERSVREILERALEATSETVIWATSTPVNEQLHNTSERAFIRLEQDLVAYNRVSCKIANELGIPVNDLYNTVVEFGQETLQKQDGVHFTPEGYVVLGKAVAKFIRKCL